MINFEHFTNNEFYNYLYNRDIGDFKLKTDENCSFEGFHYFSPRNFDYGSIEDFLVAFQDEEIVGVLCYGEYGYQEKYQGISFIDVHRDFRNRGIATSLIKELNHYINPNMKLELSKLSEGGERFKIDEIFKKYVFHS